MLTFAICDDEPIFCEQYSEMIRNQLEEEVKIHTYTDAQEFLDTLWKENFDIVLLDIDMPGVSGFDIAREMSSMNTKPLLIFVTSQDMLVYETFRYHPFHFVRKSYAEEELMTVVQEAVDERRRRRKNYCFRYENEMVSVSLEEITYIESTGNYLELHTTEGMYRIRGTMINAEHDLAAHGFVRIHKGYLVNERAVYRIGANEVELVGNIILPMGRSNKERAKEQLMRYLMS